MLTLAQSNSTLDLAVWIPTLPFLAMVVCGVLFCFRSEAARAATGWVTVGAIAGSFIISMIVFGAMGDAAAHGGATVHFFEWINIGDFSGDFSFYLDMLTMVMLTVVTGIGTLIAVYAMGYMKGDEGYGRFFTYIALFIFAMTCLVMADNLLLLFLGWEGVGLASYLLIGFYYRKPSAAEAAKKAFIVNRIGDFGFALGLMAVFLVFGSIQFDEILPAAQSLIGRDGGSLAGGAAAAAERAQGYWAGGADAETSIMLLAIPFLLMLGAFGKSAQLPLHVWLPDAMEGPTPVSALIHAATMVTAGVYMIARLIPLFELNPVALTVVAVVGCVTALFAATIALCQYDIKRAWAYSTISQLGYMFLAVGVLSTTGAIFHLFTHAFFKALLFLTAGSVMHAMAGQLDLRHMSGLGRKMPVTAGLMLVGCLALAGFPYITSGFYSKDLILADTLVVYPVLGWLGILTALITAFYAFRVWFRVFVGPTEYEMGHEHHGYPISEPAVAEERAADDPLHAPHHGEHHGHHDEPHEMGWWPMNGPLVVLAVGALFGGLAYSGFIETIGVGSTAAVSEETKATAVGLTVDEYHHEHEAAHAVVTWVAGLGAVVMIVLAGYFHWMRRDLTERIAVRTRHGIALLHNAYYVDRIYGLIIRLPLRLAAWVCYLFDRVLVDGLLINTLLGRSPRWAGSAGRRFQGGALQGYALKMSIGVGVIMLLIVMKTVL